MNLPDEAVYHPDIVELSIMSIDMILLGNVSDDTIPHITELNDPFARVGYCLI